MTRITLTITHETETDEHEPRALWVLSTEIMDVDGRAVRKVTREAAERALGDCQMGETIHAEATGADGRELAYVQLTR